MKTRIFTVLAVMTLIVLWVIPGTAQTVHYVNAGENTLFDVITDSLTLSGDIIELVDDGGVYVYTMDSDKIEVDKVLTIRAAEGLNNKPIIRNDRVGSTSNSTRNLEIISGGSLTLIGLEFDGSQYGDGVPYAKQGIRLNAGDSTNVFLKIYDCYFHDYTENFFRGYIGTVVDTVIVQNSVFYNSVREALLLYDTNSNGPAVNYALYENLTIAKVGREAVKFGSAAVGYNPEVIINHVTVDSSSLGGNYRVLRFDGGGTNVTNATIKNSILTNQMGTYENSIRVYGTSTVSYSDTFNVRPVRLYDSATIGEGMIDADPMYLDPANVDFTLQEGSPALGAADDGYAMGDLRWDLNAQGPKVHRISAGENTLYDAILAAASGDIIELVDDGGVYVYTMDSDKIEVDKVLTIRAAEGLNNKPIIRNDRVGSTSNSTRNLEIISGGSLTLIGLEFDGSQYGDGVPYAKQGIRLNAGDSTNVFLKIYDCYFHDYTENFFRGYIGTVVDTVIVQNSVFYNSVREALLLYDTNSNGPAVNYALYENLTIAKVGREAVKFGSAAVGYNPEVIINHVTVDSSSLGGNYRVLRFDGGGTNVTNATIKNSILTNQMGTYENSIRVYGTSTVSYSDTFNVRPVRLYDSATIGEGMIDADPMYHDVANGDYRLALTSLARGAADDGRAMGDLRWEADPGQFVLQVNIVGQGSVTRSEAGPFYDPATVVTLNATAAPGWEILSWDGTDLGFPPNRPTSTVTMNDNKVVTVTFGSLSVKHTLDVTVVPDAYGHIELSPAPEEGNLYEEGTEVTLTAVADSANWTFNRWAGALEGTDNPLTVSVDSSMSLVAYFMSTLQQDTLEVLVVGKGSVAQDPAPMLGSYNRGTVVTLTPEADLGWGFDSWSGDVTGTDNPLVVTLDTNMTITATFAELVVPSVMEIDTTWDLRDAVEFANNNSYVDTLVLVTSGGLYTSYSTSDIVVMQPLTVMAQPGLEIKPVLTISDPEVSNDDIFRACNDFTIIGVVLDGGHEKTHGPKYGIRLRNYSVDTVKTGSNITVMDCDFIDFFEDKNPLSDGHPFKIDDGVKAGDVLFENCTFKNTGYEAIKIANTETWLTDAALASLTVRNCTFTNIDAECIRYYSDLDPATPDAPVVIEHVTIDNSGHQAIYLKNSGGAIVRDIIVSNSRQSPHRNGYIMDIQGNTGVPSFVSYIDTFNVAQVEILSTDGEVDSTTIFGFDPMYQDAENLDFTLLAGSPAYGAAHDGLALGDLRWSDPEYSAVEMSEIIPMAYTLEQNYPNPFNPSTTIKFSLKNPGLTTLKIYDVLGRVVTTLVNEEMKAGVHEVRFADPRLATGVYFYHLSSGEFQSVKKMLLIK